MPGADAHNGPGRERTRDTIPLALLVGLFGLELILAADGIPDVAPAPRALALLGCGLALGTIPLLGDPPHRRGRSWRVPRARLAAAWIVLVALTAVHAGPHLLRALQRYPLDPALSDIYPQVTVNVRHLLDGEPVYREHEELGRAIVPTWLPLQWLPFLLTTALGVDHRFLPPVALGALVLGLGLVDIRRRTPGPRLALALVAALLVPWTIIVFNKLVAGWTMELLIGAYYLLLSWALRERTSLLTGVGLGLCLLSRYALAPWTLLLGLAHVASGRLRALTRTAAVAGLIVLVFYVLPFLSRDPRMLARSYAAYGTSLATEWARPRPESHLWNGYGLAGWVSDHTRGGVERRFAHARRLHLMVSLGIVALLVPVVVRRSLRQGDPSLTSLYALKVALAFFYAFVPVPYPYLWVVPVVVSSQVLAAFVLPSAASEPLLRKP